MDNLFGILLAVVLFGLSIFVHELGHFLVAKWCGLKINSFSIGFGKALWKKTVNGVEYRLGFLPFGGYVALPQMYGWIMEDQEEFKNLPPIHPVKRILVAVAGGIGNILFALFLGLIIYVVGIPTQPREQDAVIGYVEAGTPAAQAGLEIGQTILSIQPDGKKDRPVKTFEAFMNTAAMHTNVTITVQPVDPAAEPFKASLPTKRSTRMGFNYVEGLDSRSIIRIGSTPTNSPAAKAGLQAEDIVTHINGEKMWSWPQMTEIVKVSTNKPLVFTVKRRSGQGKTAVISTNEVSVTPARSFSRMQDQKSMLGRLSAFSERRTSEQESSIKLRLEDGKLQSRAMIGIAGHTIPIDFDGVGHPSPVKEVKDAGKHVFEILGAFFSPRTAGAASRAVSGPLGIFAVLYIMQENIMFMLSIALLINVNLAIVNLLPLPVLDGSQICYALYRLVTGRELPKQLLIFVTNLFVVVLFTLMFLLVFRDYGRFFGKQELPDNVELVSEAEALQRNLLTIEDLENDPYFTGDIEKLRTP